ncbi:hypothetical protein EDD11_008563 [Mortierella claussenii]|nr:hypothetical protein EDD11_008563 [Mortierella claussenii]
MTGAKNTPKIILGTMTFGLDTTDSTTTTVRVQGVENIRPFLDSFHAHGHNEVDTARLYCRGDTETALGQLPLEPFKLATKVWPTVPKAHGSEHLKKTLRESLAALKVKKVDIFYLHAPDYTTPFEETIRAVDELYREGLFERAGGLLSGRYNFDNGVQDDGRFGSKTGFGKIYRERFWNNLFFEAVKKVEQVSKENNLTAVETALRWMVHHSNLDPQDGIIVGASSLHHLEDNLRDLEKGPLPENVVEALDEAWEHVKVACPSYFKTAAAAQTMTQTYGNK